MSTRKWSDEVRKKMSESAKMSWQNPEIRKKRLENHQRGHKKLITLKCKGCKKEFKVLPGQHKRKYCTFNCLKVKRTVQCSTCGKNIERNLNETNKTGKYYCSIKCRGIGRRKKILVTCESCGKEFKKIPASIGKNNFCSKKCVDKEKITGRYVYCKRCGTKFWEFKSRERTYCSTECAQIFSRSYRYNENDYKRSNQGKSWSIRVKKRDNYTCQKCGSKEQLIAHHILSWKDYPNERYKTNNGRTLCIDCHLKIHGQTDRQTTIK